MLLRPETAGPIASEDRPNEGRNRRQFLRNTSAAIFALSAASYVPTTFAAEKTRRVGLIGCGWYGKSDLWRLAQVAPIEIVSICDPDKHMLAEAVEIASQRQKSH